MLLERIDRWPRIRYFVDAGLVPRAPTPVQLACAEHYVGMNAGPLERLQEYAKRPWQLLTSRANAQTANKRQEMDVASGLGGASSQGLRRVDQLFLFPPLRFVLNTAISPYYLLPGSGLDIPMEPLIHHLLSQPHTSALWDAQLLQASPGGLDRLRALLAACRRGHGARWTTYRLLVQRKTYYDYLDDLIERCERFDFPATPPGFVKHLENLVHYLNWAADLDDQGQPSRDWSPSV